MAGAQPEGTLNPTAIYITLAIPALNPTTIYYTLEVRHRQSAVNSSRIEGEAWGVKFLLGWGAGGWGWGWVLAGWTGLVLSAAPHSPARLVYGSAALVASLRGQQSHFARLPIIFVAL